MKEVGEYLLELDYPGRVIMTGAFLGGRPAIMYVVTGRSYESKTRRLVRELGRVKVVSLLDKKDELREYDASISLPTKRIISNGLHGEEIAKRIDSGLTLSSSLEGIEPEPDRYLTPRIAAVYDIEKCEYSLMISREGVKCVWSKRATPGYGSVLPTYDGSVEVGVFKGNPVLVKLPATPEVLLEEVWEALNEEFRVGVYVSDGIRDYIKGINE